SLIAGLETSSIDGLLYRVGSENTKRHRNARLQRNCSDSLGYLIAEVFEVRSFPADQRAQANESVIFLGAGQLLSGKRNFERSRHLHHQNILVRDSSPF